MDSRLLHAALTFALVSAVFLAGCEEPPAPANESGWSPAGVSAVAEANNQLALDLYARLSGEEGNVFFSPYSLSSALALTYEGARGQTAEEMQSVLHVPADESVRRVNYARIYNVINRPSALYTLSTANALWAQQDYLFLQEYVGVAREYYGANVSNMDFVGDSEGSRQTINGWVEAQTNDKIKDLIPPGILDQYTRLVLTNAIYFKGTWVKQFDEGDTREEDFTTGSGAKVEVMMMRLTGEEAKFNYGVTEDVQLLELPYDGGNLSMLVILPKQRSGLTEVEVSLTPEKLSEWRKTLRERRVDVYLPRFKYETKYLMADTLSGMGMPTAFTPAADFSGMDGTTDLYIQQVIHQAFVEVNEECTEAAAATAIVMTLGASMSDVFRADHPFIFLIQEKETGAILFMGRVDNPAG